MFWVLEMGAFDTEVLHAFCDGHRGFFCEILDQSVSKTFIHADLHTSHLTTLQCYSNFATLQPYREHLLNPIEGGPFGRF